MWKPLFACGLLVAGCAAAPPAEPAPEAQPTRIEFTVEASVWVGEADWHATREFYEALGLKVEPLEIDDFRPLHALEISDGESSFRILFVPRELPYARHNEPTVRDYWEEPDYPLAEARWTVHVPAARFEALREAPGARVVRLDDGRDSIALRDPAGFNVQVLSRGNELTR